MNGQKQWTRVAVMALLVLTVMAAEGGKGEKQGDSQTIAVYLQHGGAILLSVTLQPADVHAVVSQSYVPS